MPSPGSRGSYCPLSSTSANYAWILDGSIVGTGPSCTPTALDLLLDEPLYLVIYPYAGEQSTILSGPIEIE